MCRRFLCGMINFVNRYTSRSRVSRVWRFTVSAFIRLYSRVVVCEIRKIKVYYIDFSRPSPESKSGREIHQKNRFGSGSMSPFREIAVLTPHSQNRQPAYRLSPEVSECQRCRRCRGGVEKCREVSRQCRGGVN